MRVTVEQATDMFIKLAIKQGIDPSTLDRAAIAANFTEVFARKTAEAQPEQIAAAFVQTAAVDDLDAMIARGEV